MKSSSVETFNSPLEAGLRILVVLVPAYPQAIHLNRLVTFDYLVVHSGDIGGPDSLHPQIPQRSAELLVRRRIVERGLELMMHRGLVERALSAEGILYRAGDFAGTFLGALTSPYTAALRQRGAWVSDSFSDVDDDTLRRAVSKVFGRFFDEFQAVQRSLGGDT